MNWSAPSSRTRELKKFAKPWGLFFGRHYPLEERFYGSSEYLVADGGVRPSSVEIDLNELDGGVIGVNPSGEARSTTHFVLRRRKERLCCTVIGADASAAARQAHVNATRPPGEHPADILAPLSPLMGLRWKSWTVSG